MSDVKINLVPLADLAAASSSLAAGSAVDVACHYNTEVRVVRGGSALRVESDDGQPIDEEQMQALLADDYPEPGSDLGAVNERLRKCGRPAHAEWMPGSEPGTGNTGAAP